MRTPLWLALRFAALGTFCGLRTGRRRIIGGHLLCRLAYAKGWHVLRADVTGTFFHWSSS